MARGCRPKLACSSGPDFCPSARCEKTASSTALSSVFDAQKPNPICKICSGEMLSCICCPRFRRGLLPPVQKQELNSVAAFCPRPLATESCRCLVSAFDPKQTLAFGTEFSSDWT